MEDKNQCANIEILSDFVKDIAPKGEVFVVRRARSVEALHVLEGIVYFDEPVTGENNYVFDLKFSINNEVYYIDYDDFIVQYEEKLYEIHPKFKVVLLSIIHNSEISEE